MRARSFRTHRLSSNSINRNDNNMKSLPNVTNAGAIISELTKCAWHDHQLGFWRFSGCIYVGDGRCACNHLADFALMRLILRRDVGITKTTLESHVVDELEGNAYIFVTLYAITFALSSSIHLTGSPGFSKNNLARFVFQSISLLCMISMSIRIISFTHYNITVPEMGALCAVPLLSRVWLISLFIFMLLIVVHAGSNQKQKLRWGFIRKTLVNIQGR